METQRKTEADPYHLLEHQKDLLIKSAEFWRTVDWQQAEQLANQLLYLELQYDHYTQEYPEGSYIILHGEEIINTTLEDDGEKLIFSDQQKAIDEIVKKGIKPVKGPILIHQVSKKRAPKDHLIAFSQPVWFQGKPVWWTYDLPRHILEAELTFRDR